MLFNSIDFAIFLPIVFFLYWFVTNKSLKLQNFLLLVSSYFFYACWDWRFLFLLMFSTFLDYFTGFKMAESDDQKVRKIWLWLSISINLGFLGIFKYYNFFVESFVQSLSFLGLNINPWTLNIILPIGISFYTFHGLSYVLDIYNNKIKAERNIIDYAVFVSFFPLLVAGPIERATHLLPQIKAKRTFDYSDAVDGMRQILWGLFKKIVIADNCAEMANAAFNNQSDFSGFSLVIGVIFFAFQVYGDFSGYSDIAIGVAKLFGIKLLRNFAFPYFARDIAEFWRRWHISLTSWFRDYLYIPLGGNQGGRWLKFRNIMIIFLVSGFWHGANWTFIVFGAIHAFYFLPLLLRNKNRENLDIVAHGKYFPSLKEFFQMLLTFGLFTFSLIFFRAESLGQALDYLSRIFSTPFLTSPQITQTYGSWTIIILIIFFFLIEWFGREGQYALDRISDKFNRPLRYAIYYTIVITLFWFGGKEQQFIYFQF